MSERERTRFWGKVDRRGDDECWPWKASTFANSRGYGQHKMSGKNRPAHRVAWEMTFGAIPQHDSYHGWCVCHRCDNPRCCNPAHLFLGTTQENTADRHRKGRDARVCGSDSVHAKLTPEDVLSIRASSERHCVLARRHGVAESTIRKVRQSETWTDQALRTSTPIE